MKKFCFDLETCMLWMHSNRFPNSSGGIVEEHPFLPLIGLRSTIILIDRFLRTQYPGGVIVAR
jgi:hypothetical protein